MLPLTIPAWERFDQNTNNFYEHPEVRLELEHSLYTISKWEANWHLPFLTDKPKNTEQIRDYIRCMTMNEVSDPFCYYRLTDEDVAKVEAYIDDPMTATTFREEPGKGRKANLGKFTTSEEIYYMMTALQIPFECQHWHLARLLTLIRVCNIKQQPPKKIPKGEQARQNRALNAARRKRHGTRG